MICPTGYIHLLKSRAVYDIVELALILIYIRVDNCAYLHCRSQTINIVVYLWLQTKGYGLFGRQRHLNDRPSPHQPEGFGLSIARLGSIPMSLALMLDFAIFEGGSLPCIRNFCSIA